MISVKFLQGWKGEVSVEGSGTLRQLIDAMCAVAGSLAPIDVASCIVKVRVGYG